MDFSKQNKLTQEKFASTLLLLPHLNEINTNRFILRKVFLQGLLHVSELKSSAASSV